METIYGRIVTKAEERQIRRAGFLFSSGQGELIPAFDATAILGFLELSRDEVKTLHKLLGGSGEADRIILFRTVERPMVQSIPLKRSDEVRRILRGAIVKEVKFRGGTAIVPL